ncbi:hypothetical protein BGZ54_002992 [Gamsiella multidivaricata]|nr:hypothetical protein BGZ54_002992 [Gamsiella multidivaricata]
MTVHSKESIVHPIRTKSVGTSAIASDIKVRTKERAQGHPHPYLHGNFYPVFEETVGDEGIGCEVIGVIPESLRGSQYIRTGPNSLNVPKDGAPHHFFSGEGMLHGVYFEPGTGDETEPIRARYMNRYVRSEVFQKANAHGQMGTSLGRLMTSANGAWSIIFSLIWYRIKSAFYGLKGHGNGNTALAFFKSRLLALQEAGKPMETSVPSLNTTGEYYFEEDDIGESERNKKQGPTSEICTAHPKVDPKTGELIFFSWRMSHPFMYYSVISAEGKRLVWEEPIPGLKKSAMMHDFATTPSYSVIMNVPYFIDAPKHMKEGKPIIAFDPSSPSHFGIIPRYFDSSKDEVIWFESRACHIFHTANAWEEKDANGNVVAVCMTACRSERFIADINLWQPTGTDGYGGGKTQAEYEKQYSLPGSGDYANQDPDATYMTLIRFDLKTRQTQLTTLSTVSSEFPVINWDRYMQPTLRYVYGATIEEPAPGIGLKFNGIVKTDIQAAIKRKEELMESGEIKNVGSEGQWELGAEELQKVEEKTGGKYRFGPHIFGSEALFVPNSPSKDGKELDEDDGHLLVYVYDERQMEDGVTKSKNQVTELWIFDAKKIGQEYEPVAKVKIPRRVPYGFHGLHVSREQIQANKELLSRRVRA